MTILLNKEQKLFTKRYKKRYTYKTSWNLMKSIFKIFILTLLVLFILAGSVLFIAYKSIEPKLQEAQRVASYRFDRISDKSFAIVGNTEIYDKDMNLIDQVNSTGFIYAPISEIPKYIVDGYVSVEDRDFYNHNGINIKSIGRAAVALKENDGEVTQGGSTITQQLLKLNILNDIDDKWDRKMIEFFLAPKFEEKYSKDKIMEFYCNTNFYGNRCYGIGSAAFYYFGKKVEELTLGESAILIGLSNNPSEYDPIKHPEACIEKRDFVINTMYEQGAITEEQQTTAKQEPLNLVLKRGSTGREYYTTSFALHSAALKLMELDGFNFQYTFQTENLEELYKQEYNRVYSEKSKLLRNGGYRIYTSFDQQAQNKLQELLDNEYLNAGFTQQQPDGRYEMQSSATLIDNKTGLVIAMVGGRGKDDEYNRAYQANRQPGSSIKPIIDYAPAFDKLGYFPTTPIDDSKDKNDKAFPSNWDNRYVGLLPIKEALARSTNTVAYRILQQVGVNTGLNYLASMNFSGLDYWDLDNGSLAIGGFTYGTTTFEMAKAYHTIFNKGNYTLNNCITKIEFTEQGNTTDIYTLADTQARQIYKEESAFMTLNMMKDVLTKPYATGTRMNLTSVNIEAAGKTGTTNDNKDGWFCGITPAYTLAVWAGYDTPKEIKGIGEGKYPGQIWKNMQIWLYDTYQDLPRTFTPPDSIVFTKADRSGNPLPTGSVKPNTPTSELDVFPKVITTPIDETYQKEQAEIAQRQAEAEAEAKRKAEQLERRRQEQEQTTEQPAEQPEQEPVIEEQVPVVQPTPIQPEQEQQSQSTQEEIPETVLNMLNQEQT